MKEGLTMANRILKERKKQWVVGVSFCAMASMAFIHFNLTGAIVPFPYSTSAEATVPQVVVPHIPEVKSASIIEAQLPKASVQPQPQPQPQPRPDSQPLPASKPEPVKESVSQAYKKIALTFDDGPDNKYTPLILDILKKNKVKATFFVVGIQVNKHPEILRRIHEEGHAIGNHTWDHADLSKLSSERIGQEIKDTDALIETIIGERPSMVRAPYGAVSDKLDKVMENLKRPLISWNVDPKDWAGTSSANMLHNIKSHVKSDSIILLHSFGGKHGNLDNTIEALPKLIAFLKEEGYQMVTVPELNKIP
jgi:peptidoglycan/xylan/chitin deacetylase (PgdA/CDA1 family)